MSRIHHRRPRRRAISSWPERERPPETVAREVRYVGSPEHKPGPGFRTHNTTCEPHLTGDVQRLTEVLREAIVRGCVGSVFEQGFPKFVWGRIDGDVYAARHINGRGGEYKGWRIEPVEYPDDPQSRLNW